MALDYIQEEAMRRKEDPSAEIRPTLYVYRIRAPIRNLLLFADTEQWLSMGGAQAVFEDEVCSLSYDPTARAAP